MDKLKEAIEQLRRALKAAPYENNDLIDLTVEDAKLILQALIEKEEGKNWCSPTACGCIEPCGAIKATVIWQSPPPEQEIKEELQKKIEKAIGTYSDGMVKWIAEQAAKAVLDNYTLTRNNNG